MQNDDLLILRETLMRAMGMLDKLLSKSKEIGVSENSNSPTPNYRRYVGGPLNEAGEVEITRRFEAGHTDSQIALDMGISLTGVSKRRGMWRRSKSR